MFQQLYTVKLYPLIPTYSYHLKEIYKDLFFGELYHTIGLLPRHTHRVSL